MKRSLIILILGFIAGGIFFNQIDKTALMAKAKNGSEDKTEFMSSSIYLEKFLIE